MVAYLEDITLLDLELFDAAFAIAPGGEDDAKRRFMTLFVQGGRRWGGSANVSKATNAQGETFAVKQLRRDGASTGPSAEASPRRPGQSGAYKQLRHTAGGSSTTPDYLTQGHVAAFYEEYRIHLAVSNLRGFPRLYGFGLANGEPLIIMEWVEGATLREAVREREKADPQCGLLPLHIVADLGIAVLTLLERAGELDERFVHRDLSPRNIMLRTDRVAAAEQLRMGDFDLCLIDFGSSSLLADPSDPGFTRNANTWRMGTPAYAPPEMLTADVALPEAYRHSAAIDVYALCSVLYELYSGRKPFLIEPQGGLSPYRLKTETAPTPLDAREPDGGALADIILAGLAPQPERRPSVRQLKAALENWKELPGQQGAGGLHVDKPTDAALWQPGFAQRALTRRKFVAVGIVALATLAAGGIAATKIAHPRPGVLDESRYPSASALYDGEPLFKAFDGNLGGWALYTAAGMIACKPQSSRECGQLREGLVALYDDISQRYGFITPAAGGSYEWAVLPAFAQAGDFHESLAATQDPETKLWGFVDTSGAWVVKPQFQAAGGFRNGVAAVQDRDNLLWGAIDREGNWLVDPRFAQLGSYSNDGFAIAQELDPASSRCWGVVDAAGAWAGKTRFAQLRRFAFGLAPALDDASALWGFVDNAGVWKIQPAFRDARPFYDAGTSQHESIAAVQDQKTQLWHFIGLDGAAYSGMKPSFWKLGDMHDGLAPAQAQADDNVVTFDGKDSYAENAGMRYGYVDVRGTWQMTRLTDLTDTSIGSAEL